MRSYLDTPGWLIVKYSQEGKKVAIDVRDSAGKTVKEPGKKTVTFIHDALQPFTQQQGPHTRTLPVFYQDVEPKLFLKVEQALFKLGVDPAMWSLAKPVILSRPRWSDRTNPKLPLGILTIGDARHALGPLEQHHWFKDKTVRRHGLHVSHVDNEQQLKGKLKKTIFHIVVATSTDWPSISLLLSQLSPGHQPRVLVELNNKKEWPDASFEGFMGTSPGTALVWHRENVDPSADQFIETFITGIVHDLALHDAVDSKALLFATPASNQGLRLSDAYQEELHRQLEQQTEPLPGSIERLLTKDKDSMTRGGLSPEPGIRYLLPETRSSIDGKTREETFHKVLNKLHFSDLSFRHETSGLLPLSRNRKEVADVDAEIKSYKTLAGNISKSSPRIRRLVKETQDRKVDIALQRDIRTLFEGMNPGLFGQDVYVNKDTVLAQGTRYHLQVRIGRPLPESILAGKPPALDPLLPEKKGGHDLDVVLYEQDFTLQGNKIQTLHLPPLGASRTVSFAVVTPMKQGPVYLRLAIFYRDHLIQAFRLDASVEEEERFDSTASQLKAELVFSRTEQFDDLDQRGARALSLAVNQDPGPGRATHTFMVKQKKTAQHVSLPEAVLGDQMNQLRKTLLEAVKEEYKRLNLPGQQIENAHNFDQTVSQLARQGKNLYRALFTRCPSLKDTLKHIRQSHGETLQFVRYDPNYAFPWSLLYDYPLPEEVYGAPPPKVCRGNKDHQPCNHADHENVICINGFWGVRHRVEQLMSFDLGMVPKLAERKNARVLLVQGERSDHTQQLETDLKLKLGEQQIITLPAGQNLLDQLWNRDKGPAMTVIIGHMETQNIQGQPMGPRLVVEKGNQWLQVGKVIDKIQMEEVLKKPQPLVLLMSCQSSAVELSTLNDLFTAMVRAGAAGVIGTETVIFTRLAAYFSRLLTEQLWKPESYGEALRQVRYRMLADGSPLAFVFTAFGDADLTFL